MPVSEETRWDRVTELFEQLLVGPDHDAILMREPDESIRLEAQELWQHHLRGSEEGFLATPMPFEVLPVFRTGDRLLNRFRIERMLGAGGMGEVYRAFDERIEEPVAIKTIARLLAHSPAIRRRIAAEVQNARRVTHPNVCRIHELFDDGEIVFFSMELIEGKLLSETLADPVPKELALQLILQIAEGLHAAHRTGVVHGDLKPTNIMVTDGAEPRAIVMDFGLARAADINPAATKMALSMQAGTLDYMAPELHSGAAPSIRSDIFAFGKVATALAPRERLWEECLRPHPEERIGSLETVIRRLQNRSSRRVWIGGVGLALAAAAGYDALRRRNAVPALPDGARVLINGFQTAIGIDPIERLVRGLFVTGIAQSPRIHALADEDLLPTLRKLQAGAKLPATGSLLEQLLAKLRAAYWIDGKLEQSGGRLSLVVRLFRAEGSVLIADNAFRDFASVASLAGEAAHWVRQTSGESDTSLDLNSASASEYTSAVPEALSKYYDAMERYAVADMQQAIPLFREALRFDEGFAQAHAMLASALNGEGDLEQAFEEIDRAMQLAKKLPERERARVEVFYYAFTSNSAKAIEVAHRIVSYHPDEPRYYRSLARNLARSGHTAEAVAYNRTAANLTPEDAMMRNELVENLAIDCQFAEALRVFEERADLAERVPYIYHGQAMALMGLERYAEASRALEKVPLNVPAWLAAAKILGGELRGSIATLLESVARADSEGIAEDRFNLAEFLCGLYYLTDQPALAVLQVQKMLDLPQVPFAGRYLAAAVFWAGRVDDMPS
jgi:tetratricopeptide (TPR) repeat protein